MKLNNREKGVIGENIAADFLKKSGYKILDRNWHYSRYCELDIVAKDGNELVFVEVKFRTTAYCGLPVESVNYNKMINIKKAILAYLQQTSEFFNSYRLDIISILGDTNPQIEHIKNIEMDF